MHIDEAMKRRDAEVSEVARRYYYNRIRNHWEKHGPELLEALDAVLSSTAWVNIGRDALRLAHDASDAASEVEGI